MANEIETAGNTNQIFFADGALRQLQCFTQTCSCLIHLTAYFGIHICQGGPGEVKFEWLMHKPPATKAQALEIRDRVMSNPLLKGTLVSEDAAIDLWYEIVDFLAYSCEYIRSVYRQLAELLLWNSKLKSFVETLLALSWRITTELYYNFTPYILVQISRYIIALSTENKMAGGNHQLKKVAIKA